MSGRTGRYACYCMTRNIYHKVIPSLKSLLMHADLDRVFLLTEDDDIGLELPDCVEIINVRDQKFFPGDGPNYANGWTWMVMMRMALCYVFPDLDRILSLDLDTIVDCEINELWDMPIENHYAAACLEPGRSKTSAYFNCGVMLVNLKKMRDGKADEIIHALNTNKYAFVEQDCMNELCSGEIYEMSGAYNFCNYTDRSAPPKIYHFAASRAWYECEPLVKKYKDIPWPDVLSEERD